MDPSKGVPSLLRSREKQAEYSLTFSALSLPSVPIQEEYNVLGGHLESDTLGCASRHPIYWLHDLGKLPTIPRSASFLLYNGGHNIAYLHSTAGRAKYGSLYRENTQHNAWHTDNVEVPY